MDISSLTELNPPERILLGPGPSNLHPRVQRALSMPLVGHLDPSFVAIMDETVELLRATFQTRNALTLPISGTGSAGMETAFCNLVECGDTVVIGVNGLFGERMVDVAQRCGAEVVQVLAEWGRIVEPDAIRTALQAHKDVKLVCVVSAETSTGARQPLEEIARITHEAGALLVVDTVTALGGIDVPVDALGIDFCYSGTQKCLSSPPGLAPITVGERAREKMSQRKQKNQSWYLDLGLIGAYWGTGRIYHHTAPVSNIYALRESLRLIHEEGLAQCFARHERNGRALQAGLEGMGLPLHAQAGYRLCDLTTVRIPEGVDELRVRQTLLREYSIEIGAGLGPLKGKVWRIGLMGYSSRFPNVILVLTALEEILRREGYDAPRGAGVEAALRLMQQA